MFTNLRHSISALTLLIVATLLAQGCSSGPPLKPTENTSVESSIIQAPFSEAWQATKQALQTRDFTIFTRDKRGLFVAYVEFKQRRFQRHRTEYIVVLEAITTTSTRVTVEATHQRFEVTFLTHPAWRNTHEGPGFQSGELLRSVTEIAQLNMAEKSSNSGD